MMLKIKSLVILLIIGGIGWLVYDRHHQTTLRQAAEQTAQSAAVTAKAKAEAAAQAAQAALDAHCSGNGLSKKIIVDISQQHMWACGGTKAVYDNAVITGMEQYGDSTPLGTYKIYSKLTDQTLKGCDPSGCWNDPVSYWLPYQQASGGTVGFHDANWRKTSDFGHITPSSGKGSHGCVEMPTAAAKWLYRWSKVGTSVTIQA